VKQYDLSSAFIISLCRYFIVLSVTGFSLLLFLRCQGTTSTVTKPESSGIESVSEDEMESETNTTDIEAISDEERQRQALIEYNLGYQYFNNKNLEEALPHLWNTTKLDKELKYPGIYRRIGEAYIQLEKPDSAQIAYEIGARLVPDDIFIHRRLQWLYEIKNDFSSSIDELKKIIELVDESEVEEYYTKLAELLMKEDRIEEAMEVYKTLSEKYPDNRQYKEERMSLFDLLGDQDQKINQLLSLHQEYPLEVDYIRELLHIFTMENDYDNILAFADKLLEIEPENTDALRRKSDVYNDLEKFNDTIAMLQKILEITPEDPQTLCDIAEAYINMGNYSRARSFARRALQKDPNFGLAYILIGDAYLRCAEDCIERRGGISRIRFDDKLIYQMAYEQYSKAAKYPAWNVQKMNAINGFIN